MAYGSYDTEEQEAGYDLPKLANSAGISGFDGNDGPDSEPDTDVDDASQYQLPGFTQPQVKSYGGVMGGELQAPEGVQIPQAAFPGPTKESGTGSASVALSGSGRGYSEAKAKQIDKRDVPLARDIAAADQTAESQMSEGVRALRQSREVSTGAAGAVANAQVEKITGEALAAQRLADINQQFALGEEEINAHYTAKQNQAQMDYVQALNDFRASRVDPSQLWKNMSGGMQFGTLVSAFVHDFLGAKGIKTSAMSSLNAAIDRNIAAQEYAIKTKGEVTQGFKTLWDMQREQSASDAEARARVRGFMLESAKQAITANMAQYEAGLATAQGKAAIAKIDEEYAKNLVNVYKEIANNTATLRGQAISWNSAKLHAANEAWSNSIRAQELAQHKKEYQDKVDKEKIKTYAPLVNPETGKVEWVFRPETTPEQQGKIKDMMAGVAGVNQTMGELRNLSREIGAKPDMLANTRVMNETTRKVDAIRTKLAHMMAAANEGRVTEQDVNQYLKSLPIETWLTNGGVDSILAWTHKEALDNAYNKIQQYTVDAPPELQVPGPQGRPFAGAYADALATTRGNKPPETTVSLAQSTITNPSGDEEASKELINKVRDLTKVEPVARIKEYYKATGKQGGDITNGQVTIAGLADAARSGNGKAYLELKKWAESGANNSSSAFAKWEFDQIQSESTSTAPAPAAGESDLDLYKLYEGTQ